MVACFGSHHIKAVYDEKSNQIIPAEIMTGVFTFDHRFGDAAVAGHALNVMTDFMEEPDGWDHTKFVDKITAEEREKNFVTEIEKKKN
jgi:pyruvate/2-oxoglutarate dehydrogenase complex dihydrolipoamide acyltransferase (E2) component